MLKKLVSYRERESMGRPLTEREAPRFSGVARRIVALLRVGADIEGVTRWHPSIKQEPPVRVALEPTARCQRVPF